VKVYIDLKNNKAVKTPTKILRKRLGSTPKKSPFEKKKLILKRAPVKIQNEDEIDSKLIETFDALMSRNNFQVPESSFNRYEAGICVLQEYLFLMIRDALLSIDDNRVQMDIADCIKIESLIMFANHHDANVRAAIIKLTKTLIERQSQEMVNFYQKSHYWVHFGNQIAISPVNLGVIQACANWILMNEKSLSIEEINKREKLEIKFKAALRILTEIISSTTHNAKLLKTTMQFFKLVMESDSDSIQTLANYGFVVATLKALMKVDDDDMLETMHHTLEDIATKSFLASNAIHILWELLYGLIHAERFGISKNSIHDIHLSILRHLLSLCLVEQNRRASRSSESFQTGLMVTKVLANLPSSEIKTRFNLIHDRAVQFVMSWENLDDLKSFEVDFVKYLVDLFFLGIHQGSSLLLWALNPNCLDEIRHYVAQKIITSLNIDTSFSVSEPKILKAFLHQLIASTSHSYSEDQLRVISKYCGVSLNQQQQNYALIMASSEKIETMHQNAQREQSQQIEKILFKNEPLSLTIIDGAMRMTREVIDLQNRERRQLMTQLKKTQEIDFYHEWYELINRMTHEGGPWFNAQLYPSTFELDETEGPARMRIRMKRTALKIEKRFFMDGFKQKASYQHKKQLLDFILHPEETERYSINEQIIFTFNGKHLTLEHEIEGKFL
jgi:lysosomal-trafficking regulator